MNGLAQVFPSSAASVGVILSNRTLEVGLLQVEVGSFQFSVTFEQCPTADDPLTANNPTAVKL